MNQLTFKFEPFQLDLFPWRSVPMWVVMAQMIEITLRHSMPYVDRMFEELPILAYLKCTTKK